MGRHVRTAALQSIQTVLEVARKSAGLEEPQRLLQLLGQLLACLFDTVDGTRQVAFDVTKSVLSADLPVANLPELRACFDEDFTAIKDLHRMFALEAYRPPVFRALILALGRLCMV